MRVVTVAQRELPNQIHTIGSVRRGEQCCQRCRVERGFCCVGLGVRVLGERGGVNQWFAVVVTLGLERKADGMTGLQEHRHRVCIEHQFKAGGVTSFELQCVEPCARFGCADDVTLCEIPV